MLEAKTRILILGGGFGGLYTALSLEKRLARRQDIEITLVSRDNFLLFTPMLHEVAASDIDPSHIINPIQKMLRRTKFFCGTVQKICLEEQSVVVSHGLKEHSHTIPYDHLVLALGSITHFYNSQEIQSAALTMKSLEDAMKLRSRIIALLEEADFECCAHIRRQLLTFVVVGGGFAGVETIAAVNHFIRSSLKFYRNISSKDVQMILIHSGETLLPELSEKLGRYTHQCLSDEGIQIITQAKVTDVRGGTILLSNETSIESSTLVWTAGTKANPAVEQLHCKKERGRIVVNEHLELPEFQNVWALGDCASCFNKRSGKPHPPTAQHAIRQAKVVAHNIAARTTKGTPLKSFAFQGLGQLASIGRRTGVANIFGRNFSGFLAWFLWRSVYLLKLPRLEKKVRVALDWTMDLVFSKDLG